MSEHQCEHCGKLYNFIEGDTPEKYLLFCSDGCIESEEYGTQAAADLEIQMEHNLERHLEAQQ